VGIITAQIVRENDDTITNTGGQPTTPPGNGIDAGGNHKSHCAWSPGEYMIRSAGSAGAYSGRINATRLRNHEAEPDQPTRSAITVAGIDGVCDNRARICNSNLSNADAPTSR